MYRLKRIRGAVAAIILALLAALSLVFAAACSGDSYTLTFVTDGGSDVAPITAKAGEEITPPQDPVKDGYTFGGWRLTQDGEAVELPTVMPKENRTYYAIWTANTPSGPVTPDNPTPPGGGEEPKVVEYGDLFGGSDILKVDDGKIYLIRRGFDEVEGHLTAGGYFYFGTEESKALEGILAGDKFYYFRDISGKTFVGDTNAQAYIKFTGENNVAYNFNPQMGGTEEVGTFTVGEFCRDFLLIRQNGDATCFKLNAAAGTFTRVTANEVRGLYFYKTASGATSFLFLDGYRTNGQNTGTAYAYDFVNGELSLAFSGEYSRAQEILDAQKFYYTVQRDGGTSAFRIAEGAQTVEGFEVNGTFETADSMLGRFVSLDDSMNEDARPTVVLDGFGRGYIREGSDLKYGDYKQVNYVLTMYSSSGFYPWTDTYAEFTYDAGGDPVYIKVEETLGGLAAIISDTKPHLQYFDGGTEDLYGQNLEDPYPNLALYAYDSASTLILSWMDDTEVGMPVYEIIDEGSVEEVEGSDGEYRFTSVYFANDGSFFFDFKESEDEDENGNKTLIYGRLMTEEDEVIQITGTEDTVTLGKYGDVTYTYVSGGVPITSRGNSFTVAEAQDTRYLLQIYTLNLAGGDKYLTVKRDYQKNGGDYVLDVNGNRIPDDATMQAAIYGADKMVEIVYSPYYQYDGAYDRLLITGENSAIMCFNATTSLTSLEMVQVWFSGTLSNDGGAYTFTVSDQEIKSSFSDDVWELYSTFRFRYSQTGSGEVNYFTKDAHVYDTKDGGTISFDGYGTATVTDESGNSESYTYEGITVTKYNEDDKLVDATNLAVYALTKGEDTFFWYTEDGVTFSLAEGAFIATYSFMDGDGMIGAYPGMYMLFLENFGAVSGQSDKAYVIAADGYVGLYKITDIEITLGMSTTGRPMAGNEYEVTLPWSGQYEDGTNVHGVETQNMLVLKDVAFNMNNTEDDDSDTDVMTVFLARPYSRGTFTVDGRANALSCDGYNPGIYSAADNTYTGVMLIGHFGEDGSFGEDPDGPNVLFYYAPEIYDDGIAYTKSFVFDIDQTDRTVAKLRPLESGLYRQYSSGKLDDNYLQLDGYGEATLKTSSGATVKEGTYKLYEVDEEGVSFYLFESGQDSFTFTLTVVSTGFFNQTDSQEQVQVFVIKEEDKVYVNDDWSALVLDYKGNAYNIDKFGFVTEGTYMSVTSDLVAFETPEGSGYRTIYFDLLADKKFRTNLDDFIVREGVLYAYQGESRIIGLKIPDGVTKISDRVFMNLGGIRDYLDLNEVEEIGDYAFANVNELIVETIKSDKVKRIGDYAFFSNGRAEISYFGVINYSFPNCEYVGDYAFYNNNQIRNGRVTFGSAIRHIGDYAFAHYANLNEACTINFLGLTAADMEELEWGKNVFANNYSGVNLRYCPVTIVVTDTAAKTKFEQIFAGEYEIAAENLLIKVTFRNPDADIITGRSFYNFEQNIFYGFEGGTLTEMRFDSAANSWQTKTYTYTMHLNTVTVALGADGDNDSKQLILDEGTLFDGSENLTLLAAGDTTHLKYFEEQSEEDETTRQVILRFRFSADVDEGKVTVSITYATYNGNSATVHNFYDGVLYLDYSIEDEDEELIPVRAIADFKDGTSRLTSPGVKLTSADGAYRADITTSGYYYMTLEGKETDENYRVLGESLRRTSDGDATKFEDYFWQCTVSGMEGEYHIRTIYTVHITGVTIEGGMENFDNANLVVTTEKLYVRYVYDAEHDYRAAFTSPEQNFADSGKIQLDELSKVVKDSSGTELYAEEIYKPGQMYFVECRRGTNGEFIVTTVPSVGDRSQYTVTFTPDPATADGGSITVSKKVFTVTEFKSVHSDGQPYYGVNLMFDGDALLGLPIGGDLKQYNADGSNETSHTVRSCDLQSESGGVYTYTVKVGIEGLSNDHTFTITVTEAGNSYTVTVTQVS